MNDQIEKNFIGGGLNLKDNSPGTKVKKIPSMMNQNSFTFYMHLLNKKKKIALNFNSIFIFLANKSYIKLNTYNFQLAHHLTYFLFHRRYFG